MWNSPWAASLTVTAQLAPAAQSEAGAASRTKWLPSTWGPAATDTALACEEVAAALSFVHAISTNATAASVPRVIHNAVFPPLTRFFMFGLVSEGHSIRRHSHPAVGGASLEFKSRTCEIRVEFPQNSGRPREVTEAGVGLDMVESSTRRSPRRGPPPFFLLSGRRSRAGVAGGLALGCLRGHGGPGRARTLRRVARRSPRPGSRSRPRGRPRDRPGRGGAIGGGGSWERHRRGSG